MTTKPNVGPYGVPLGPIEGRETWPDYGTLNGEPVYLPGIETRLPPEELALVVVDNGKRFRPWAYLPDAILYASGIYNEPKK
jgi:hypothetical protein